MSHAEKQSTGRIYVRSILIELGKPDDFDGWIKELVQGGRVETGGMYKAIDEVLTRLKQKVEMGETWKLPESRYGSVDRPIAKTHPKEMTMALRAAIDKESGFTLEKGHFGRYEALKDAERRLEQKRTAALAAVGKEADQRRMLVLYDNEQLDLFESILTCAVSSAQSAGDMDGAPRKPIDTLTVGVIVAVYFALGKRGVNLDDLVHGYMTIGAWNAKIWEKLSPLTLDLVTAGKGDGSTKKQDQILHHRDPMRCPISMLGLYFGTLLLARVCLAVSSLCVLIYSSTDRLSQRINFSSCRRRCQRKRFGFPSLVTRARCCGNLPVVRRASPSSIRGSNKIWTTLARTQPSPTIVFVASGSVRLVKQGCRVRRSCTVQDM